MATRVLRPIRIEGNVAYVPLTRGHEAIIDAADVPLVEGRNWNAQLCSGKIYAVTWKRASGKKQMIYMHRLFLGLSVKAEVDHANSDGLDNRRENLRHATSSQNRANSRMRSDNVTGLKGVSWSKTRRKWLAQVTKDGRAFNLGGYPTMEQAKAAYDASARQLHGEFARVA